MRERKKVKEERKKEKRKRAQNRTLQQTEREKERKKERDGKERKGCLLDKSRLSNVKKTKGVSQERDKTSRGGKIVIKLKFTFKRKLNFCEYVSISDLK